jgi:hypothetical protein
MMCSLNHTARTVEREKTEGADQMKLNPYLAFEWIVNAGPVTA